MAAKAPTDHGTHMFDRFHHAAPASPEEVARIFNLIEAKRPSKAQLRERTGQPIDDILRRALGSRFFAERKILPFFLSGERGKDEIQVPETAIRDLAAVLRGEERPAVPEAAEAAILWDWREALRVFFELSDAAGTALLRESVARFPAAAGQVGAFQDALARLAGIDAHVAAGEAVAAFILAREAVEGGGASCTGRYLRLLAAFCPDPARIEAEAEARGETCTPRFLAMLRALTRGGEARFEGMLPACYDALPARADPSPAGAALWNALARAPGLLPGFPEGGRPAVILARDGAVVIPARDGAAVEPDGGAAREGAGGPVLVLDHEAEIPPLWFELVVGLVSAPEEVSEKMSGEAPAAASGERHEAGEASPSQAAGRPAPVEVRPAELLPVEALPVLFETRADWSAGAAHLIGLEVAPIGFLARDRATARALLGEGERAAAVACRLAAAHDPLRLFGSRAATDRIAAFAPVSIVIAPPGAAETRDHPGRRVLGLPGTARAAEVADALEAMLGEPGVEAETPVVLMRADVPYPEDYAARMIGRHAARGGRIPIAARGLVIDPGDGRVALRRGGEGGFHRVAPLGLACLGLAETVAALRADPGHPAEDCVVRFAPAALAWDAGASNLGGIWSRVLARYDADPARAQRIHMAGARPLSEALISESLISGALIAGELRGAAPPAPHASHLRALETARAAAAAALTEEDPRAAFETFLPAGAEALMEDGRAEEVRDFLLGFAPRLPRVVEAEPEALLAFLHLLTDCGVQDRYGPLVAAVFPKLAARSPRLIHPAAQVMISGAPTAMLVTALTTAFLDLIRRRRRPVRQLARIAEILAAQADPETLLFVLRLCGVSGGGNGGGNGGGDLGGIRETLRPFARRLVIDQAVPTEEFEGWFEGWADPARLRAAPAPRDWLVRALRLGDRPGAIRALREMVSHHARLPELLETLRVLPAETRALALTARDWTYPAHLGPEEIVLVATLLGDREVLASHIGHASDPEIHAVAASALGDLGPLNALYAGWARAEGLSPLTFAGSDIQALFAGLAASGPAPASLRGGPLVSVLMSTYDVDPGLFELSLASLAAQSWAEIEIIIVDDGSAEENRAAVERRAAADPRIRFIGLPRNQGPYIGRNAGIAAARGAYVAIQDADDVSHPERIAYQVALLEANPRARATASDHLRVDRGARLQFQPGFGALADGTMTTLYRRSVFEELGGFAPVRSRGDVEFRARVRQALGPEAYRETRCPLVACFADSGTLSHATKRDKAAALRSFRASFTRRRWIGLDTPHPRPVGSLSIPEQLRP